MKTVLNLETGTAETVEFDADDVAQIEADRVEREAVAPRLALRAQITALEAQATPRRLREAALTDAGKAWLAGLDAEITALRTQL